MIIGIGNDIVDINRIENMLHAHGERFENKCFTAIERAKARGRAGVSGSASTYAKRFAAKEACVKAMGSGFTGDVYMRDIGVIEDDRGRPSIKLRGGALEYVRVMTPDNMDFAIHLSLSDEPPYAQAFVVIEACAI